MAAVAEAHRWVKDNAEQVVEQHGKKVGLRTPAARKLASVFPVLSTPAMISMMERTCSELLTSYLEEGEQTVGFHVDVKHLAPTRIGQTVTVTVTLQEVQERRFRFAVEAINDRGVKIGSGIHRRTLIRVKDFGQEPS